MTIGIERVVTPTSLGGYHAYRQRLKVHFLACAPTGGALCRPRERSPLPIGLAVHAAWASKRKAPTTVCRGLFARSVVARCVFPVPGPPTRTALRATSMNAASASGNHDASGSGADARRFDDHRNGRGRPRRVCVEAKLHTSGCHSAISFTANTRPSSGATPNSRAHGANHARRMKKRQSGCHPAHRHKVPLRPFASSDHDASASRRFSP